jgi:hypothetical protein
MAGRFSPSDAGTIGLGPQSSASSMSIRRMSQAASSRTVDEGQFWRFWRSLAERVREVISIA